MQHFKDMDLDDIDTCILFWKTKPKDKLFNLIFRNFHKTDVVLLCEAATPFINFASIRKNIPWSRNLFRDEQLSVADAGEKV